MGAEAAENDRLNAAKSALRSSRSRATTRNSPGQKKGAVAASKPAKVAKPKAPGAKRPVIGSRETGSLGGPEST
jgi:hypothetical protein